MEQAKEILSTEALCVGYGERAVLEQVRLSIQPGRFVAVLGPNGSGKSTLLHTVARLLTPLSGSIFIQDMDLMEFRQEELAKHLSVVLTERVYPGLFTAFEFVSLGRHPYTGILGRLSDKDMEVVYEAMTMVGAAGLSSRRLDELSDGERQKIMLARALAQEPELIVLDEPTIHLDLKHRIEVVEILSRLCREKGTTVIAALHDIDMASRVADLVILVKEGAIIASGPPEAILNETSVTSLYSIEGAFYCPELGTVEMRTHCTRGDVFVVAGMASGSRLYRLLVRHGFHVTTGVLHKNDLDWFVARATGAKVVDIAPGKKISQEETALAMEHLLRAQAVVDTGFSVSELNRENLELIQKACVSKKTVLGLGDKRQEEGCFNRVQRIKDTPTLIKILTETVK